MISAVTACGDRQPTHEREHARRNAYHLLSTHHFSLYDSSTRRSQQLTVLTYC